jgi:HK97 family phage portal protein
MRWPLRRQRSPVTPSAPLGPASISPLVRQFAESWGFGWPSYLQEHIGAASRCLQLAAQQVATLPLRHRGSGVDPAWRSNPEPALYNGLCDAIFAATWSTYARGEAFLWVTSRYETGYPASWLVLDPVTMNVDTDGFGEKQFRSNGYQLDPRDVLHVLRDPRPGKLRGTGSLEAWWSNLSSAAAAEHYAANVLDRSGVSPYALKHSKRLLKKQAEDLQAQWVEAVAGRSGAPVVLSDGLELERLAFSPRDMMLLELREFDSKQIAAAFGVPAFLLNLPQADGLNYSNPAQLFDLWWRAELMPAAHRIEVALSTWLPRGNWVEFDPSVILRPDFPTLVDTWLKLQAAGVVSVDETRTAVLDLPPLAEGDAIAQIDEPAAAGAGTSTVTDAAVLELVQQEVAT